MSKRKKVDWWNLLMSHLAFAYLILYLLMFIAEYTLFYFVFICFWTIVFIIEFIALINKLTKRVSQ